MGSIRRSIGIVAALGMAFAAASAQDDARAKLMIPEDAGLGAEVGHFPRGAPGTSTGSPIAFGANWGDIYAGAGFQAPIRYSNASDGSVAVGMGFGNSADIVGLDVGLTALSTVRSGVGNRMGLSAKLHKLLPDNWGIALGVESIYLNNQPTDGNGAASLYGVISKVWDLSGSRFFSDFRSFTLSGGVGNEGFRLEQDIRNDNKTVGVFGSAALRVLDRLSVIADWPGQDLNVGLSFVPFPAFPVVFTPAIVDITGAAGVYQRPETVRPRFSMGAGLAFKF